MITAGALTSLDMTIDSNIVIGSATFTTTGLEFTYAASNSRFTLAGLASVSIANIGNLSVTFGHGTTPGLVITAGALTSLDMTIDSNIVIGSATFTTAGLEFTYAASNSEFTLAGLASVSIANIGNLSVTFGYNGNPGLIITDGSLTSLDMTIDSNIVIGSATFTTKSLRFTYAASNSEFTLAGSAAVTIAKIGNLSVTFGYKGAPGLVITAGSLTSLDMTIDSNIVIGSATFTTKSLRFTYAASNSICLLYTSPSPRD